MPSLHGNADVGSYPTKYSSEEDSDGDASTPNSDNTTSLYVDDLHRASSYTPRQRWKGYDSMDKVEASDSFTEATTRTPESSVNSLNMTPTASYSQVSQSKSYDDDSASYISKDVLPHPSGGIDYYQCSSEELSTCIRLTSSTSESDSSNVIRHSNNKENVVMKKNCQPPCAHLFNDTVAEIGQKFGSVVLGVNSPPPAISCYKGQERKKRNSKEGQDENEDTSHGTSTQSEDAPRDSEEESSDTSYEYADSFPQYVHKSQSATNALKPPKVVAKSNQIPPLLPPLSSNKSIDSNDLFSHSTSNGCEETQNDETETLSSDDGVMQAQQDCTSDKETYYLETASQHEHKGEYSMALHFYEECLSIVRGYDSSNTGYKPFNSSSVKSVALLHKVGVVRWKLGSYGTSLMKLEDALATARRLLYSRDFDDDCSALSFTTLHHSLTEELAEILTSMGKVYVSQGDYAKAMASYKESYSILKTLDTKGIRDRRDDKEHSQNESNRRSTKNKEVNNKVHPRIAHAIICMGIVHDLNGEYAVAMERFREGVSIQRQTIGHDHVDVAATLNAIGSVYEKQGQYVEAKRCFKKALKIYTSKLGKHNVDFAVTMNYIAQSYHHLQKFEKAITSYQMALNTMKQVLGRSHRNVASILYNIALINLSYGKTDEALKICSDCLDIQIRALGDSHVDVAVTYDSIGECYESQGKKDKALKYYKSSLRIRRKGLGKHHLYVASSLERIGLCQIGMPEIDLREASQKLNDALDIYKMNGVRKTDPRYADVEDSIKMIKTRLRPGSQKKSRKKISG